ncbi:MAG: hypothetical protein ABL952_16655 [Pyrinomonadaceae bacterium]
MLIAVIGDDNNDFIYGGSSRDITATVTELCSSGLMKTVSTTARVRLI